MGLLAKPPLLTLAPNLLVGGFHITYAKTNIALAGGVTLSLIVQYTEFY